jgi:hypothetical protein
MKTTTISPRQVTLAKKLKSTLHVYNSPANSSKRTRAALVASLVNGGSRWRKRKKRCSKKSKQLNEVLIVQT